MINFCGCDSGPNQLSRVISYTGHFINLGVSICVTVVCSFAFIHFRLRNPVAICPPVFPLSRLTLHLARIDKVLEHPLERASAYVLAKRLR